ncbi:MAG: bifunctional pyr operon transcriptional regulator/uracil phosphoribosyltransferase PyrR [Acidimicrobiia bacterium]|nr:MAG: bifunctional pyr operon transcriptional regulator/uracil phosphoribosyltransferase PyrR [Acidimicrobiia bacterium]
MSVDETSRAAAHTSVRFRCISGDSKETILRQVMDSDDLGRVTKRIAHEIAERNHGLDEVVLLGIPTRGKPFADRIAAALSDIHGAGFTAGSLDVGMYRDDIDIRPRARIGPTDIPELLDGKTVVLADDVLFTGRTIRAALDALADLGRPSAVQLAVVIDRGHRELPIRADYVGKNIPTSLTEHVSVRFLGIDDEDGVWIGQSEPA